MENILINSYFKSPKFNMQKKKNKINFWNKEL